VSSAVWIALLLVAEHQLAVLLLLSVPLLLLPAQLSQYTIFQLYLSLLHCAAQPTSFVAAALARVADDGSSVQGPDA
jgi:ABC-type bacteriocin/lantibiotic exporter with double-glycine peptidase domain